jgi:hypothetical protein
VQTAAIFYKIHTYRLLLFFISYIRADYCYYGANVIICKNRLKKKGTNRTVQKWLTFVGKYIREWKSTRNNIWSSDVPFDPVLFDQYYTRYGRCTRTFLTKAKDPKGYLEPALCDMYEAGSSEGSRI